ncbi:hypothetical protein [Sphingobacterium sp. BS-2]|uniref:hypothetical protein n=1 Tax=Sphingobacterium sp. BS-2 TaxID=3377129 RepID=UPI0038FCB329
MLWIYNWGEGTARLIKTAFVFVGLALWWFASKDEVKDETPADQTTQPYGSKKARVSVNEFGRISNSFFTRCLDKKILEI